MPASEFSGALTINSVSFDPVAGTGTTVNFDRYYVYMGYCSSDELNPLYDQNYVAGTRTTVFERTTPISFNVSFPWTAISLDTPFWYNPSQGNLLIEIAWPDGSGQFYTYDYATPGVSLLTGAYGAGSGDPFTEAPHLLLEGAESFSQMTFAGIKASFY